MLDGVFKKAAQKDVPPNHLSMYSVVRMVDFYSRFGEVTTKSAGDKDKGDYATYTYDALSDGKNLSLDLLIRKDGKEYKTELKAEIVNEGVLEVKSLIFDNHVESLKNPKEIFSVLDFIGNFHTNHIGRGSVPTPHQEKGEFGKVGRFITRHMPNLGGGGSWLLKP